MSIKIHNSLTDKKEEFSSLKRDQVKMYVCGPTVYDESHLGHLRAAYVFDIIRRYLKFKGFEVTFVRNITDIDDKIINRARESLKSQDNIDKDVDLKLKVKGIADYYTKLYSEDMESFNIEKPDIEPLATEHISDMIKLIQELIAKSLAYEADGDVYFEVRKFSSYGKLSHQSIDQMMAGARIEPGEKKRDLLDFALWKKAKPDEPAWDSPWGKGRPGWHIECSVMSTKYLGQTFDIHGGGRDLIFPHHENEIAQAEAATGKNFANYWIHNGLLTINGQKMAKSLGNFITIKDFIAKYKDADFLKLFFLSTHYSHPIDFNDERIEEARKQKKCFYDFFDRVDNRVVLAKKKSAGYDVNKDKKKIDAVCNRFQEAMDDDFNTARALACLFELADLGANFASIDKEEVIKYIDNKLCDFLEIFGLKRKIKKELPAKIVEMAKERNQARVARDFKRADEIRKKIEHTFAYAVADSSCAVTVISTQLSSQ